MKKLHFLIRIVNYLALWFLGTGLSYMLANQLVADRGSLQYLTVAVIFNAIYTILLTLVFAKYLDQLPISRIGLNIKGRLVDIISAIFISLAIMTVATLAFTATGLTEASFKETQWERLGYAFILFIAVAINEEVMNRGYLQRVFNEKLSRIWSMVLSSLIFAALHLGNNNISVLSILNIFLAGLVLGVNYSYTRNLWFAIAFHFGWNFFQGPVYGFAVSGTDVQILMYQTPKMPYWLSGGYFGFEGSIFASLVLIAYLVIAFRYFEKKEKKLWQTIA